MGDWEHRELESKISNLEREISDLRYRIDRLEDELRDKADRVHHHSQYQVNE